MADEHLFVDAHDNKVMGKEKMKECWIRYFEMFPEYKIEISEILEKDPIICILGYAGGTYKKLKTPDNGNFWRIPAAWAAIIEDNKVKKWQVYADNILVMDIIQKNNEIESVFPFGTIQTANSNNIQSITL